MSTPTTIKCANCAIDEIQIKNLAEHKNVCRDIEEKE